MGSHYPVMLNEVIESLAPKSGEIYVDGTFGAGGYSRALLEKADCKVIAIDRDPAAQVRAQAFAEEFGERFAFVRGCFGDVKAHLSGQQVDGFVLDLGVSSFQLDEADRGFSFRFDGPLDMRMDKESGQSAADLINTMEEQPLADLIYRYGEERKSRRVAKVIVEKRREAPIATTAQLAAIVRACVPASKDGIDPATRTFQALRIAVNDELGEVERALESSAAILKPDGRLVVVSFHSLEDRLVKQAMRGFANRQARASRYAPQLDEVEEAALFRLPQVKPILPTDQETHENSRSRSAKLRLAVRNATDYANNKG